MQSHPSGAQSLRRVFLEAFVVADIAESLISFDSGASATELRAFMKSRRLEMIGVRRDGLVAGYVELADLGEGTCGDCMRLIEPSQVILGSSPLAEAVLKLRDERRLFVSVLGSDAGVASRTDLQKPPVRMWLFGMVTLIEMRFTRMIEQANADDSWKEFASAGRIEKAEKLRAERERAGQVVSLLDCLQFSDKVGIVARSERLRSLTRFESRRQLESAGKEMERLRNSLAHAQDIIAHDWKTIVYLSEHIELLLKGPPGLATSDGGGES